MVTKHPSSTAVGVCGRGVCVCGRGVRVTSVCMCVCVCVCVNAGEIGVTMPSSSTVLSSLNDVCVCVYVEGLFVYG